MKIEKLFSNLSNNKELIFYLFEHKDKAVSYDEIQHLISYEKLEVLENFEIIEKSDNKIFLDGRVIEFLENYLSIDENIEVSIISEKIDTLKHKIEILLEYKNKQNELISQIRRELKKCDFILLQNLFKLRIHIDRVYKSIDQYSLKIKELKFYESKLKDLSFALIAFEKFLKLFESKLTLFYNNELNEVIKLVKQNIYEINKSLIPLTQDVCEYINKAISKNIFIEKITKLKELKDSYLLKEQTNILQKIEKFEPIQSTISIKTRLNKDIIQDESFKQLLLKSKQDTKLKIKQASKIQQYNSKEIQNFLDINSLHRAFKFSSQNLIEFLLQDSKLKNKSFEDIEMIYCKLILLYEIEYKIYDQFVDINGTKFKKVYYGK
ncbi:MAG: hypothetical protein U9Q04_03495 [Campylobacterota bacterium]|nr:hypothetical protein [Campylobacterota bacterium]